MSKITNAEKYEQYNEQLRRLDRALELEFRLEAVFIEYAIIEDRCKSVLTHAGRTFSPRLGLGRKLGMIGNILSKGNTILGQHITQDMLDTIQNWKEQRDDLIHSLMSIRLTDEGLEKVAKQGKQIANELCSRTDSYKKALKQQNR